MLIVENIKINETNLFDKKLVSLSKKVTFY